MESNACRLCSSNGTDQLINIFGSIGMELKMNEIIREHFKFNISEADPLPNFVCQICWSITENFHELYEKSKALQKKFLDALVKIETEPDSETHEEDCFTEDYNPNIEMVKIKATPEDSDSEDDAPIICEDNNDDESLTDKTEEDPKCKPSNEHPTSVKESSQRENKQGGDQIQLDDSNSEMTPEKYKCSHCDRMLCSVHVLNRHIKRMHPEVIVPKPAKNRHKEKKKSEEETKFIAENFDLTCDQCDAVFKSLYDAQLHYNEFHNEPKGYVKCCGIKFKENFLVRDHVKFHLNPELFKCDICGKCCMAKTTLDRHKRGHRLTMNKSFICDICGCRFREKVAITRHIFSQHVKSEPKYECEICHKKFQIRYLLESHHYTTHREKKRNSTCEICGKSFHIKFHLDKHMLSHMDKSERLAQRQQCEHCGEWLMTKSGVFYHKQIHTSGVQTCKQCGMELANRNSLLAHIRTHHREHKFKCSFCGKTFATGSVHKKHEEIHTRHNVYPCKFCSKTYTSTSSLQTHKMRKHYEENKLYKQAKKINDTKD